MSKFNKQSEYKINEKKKESINVDIIEEELEFDEKMSDDDMNNIGY